MLFHLKFKKLHVYMGFLSPTVAKSDLTSNKDHVTLNNKPGEWPLNIRLFLRCNDLLLK